MNYAGFRIGFWHPFGPHSNEGAAQILERKREEIEANGWTLWSFKYRRMLDDWYRELTMAEQEKICVFCSSGGGSDPFRRGGTARVNDCRSYRLVGQADWRPMPDGVRVPHTFPLGKGQASAFVVQRVVHPVQPFAPPPVEWLSRDGQWRRGYQRGRRWCPGIPSRNEFLIRPGGTSQMRSVLAILELRPPYLAVVSTDPA